MFRKYIIRHPRIHNPICFIKIRDKPIIRPNKSIKTRLSKPMGCNIQSPRIPSTRNSSLPIPLQTSFTKWQIKILFLMHNPPFPILFLFRSKQLLQPPNRANRRFKHIKQAGIAFVHIHPIFTPRPILRPLLVIILPNPPKVIHDKLVQKYVRPQNFNLRPTEPFELK